MAETVMADQKLAACTGGIYPTEGRAPTLRAASTATLKNAPRTLARGLRGRLPDLGPGSYLPGGLRILGFQRKLRRADRFRN
eukprot:12025259-Alexandrium_andersonii.AAC.1